MPFGCFEQTSSATYPNVMVLHYLIATSTINPEIELKSRDYITQGYQRLLTYEVEGGGFEWFGNEPAHFVLTCVGLMEFVDMAMVHPVDSALLERTASWMASQQKTDGSFKPSTGGIAGRYQQLSRFTFVPQLMRYGLLPALLKKESQ